MQGFISSVGSIDGGGGGQGGDDERFLKIVFDLSNITPSAYGEAPNIRYSYSYTGYPSCYIVDSLGNEEAESLANVLHYYLIPIASNDEENTGVTCEFDGLMCEGIIRSETNNLQSATFYFMWYVDLNQDYLIIKNNLTYHEPQAIPEPLLEKYINVLVDLTSITPTTEVVNGKTYNKFTFAQNKLTVRSYSNSGPLETFEFSELVFYKTMPISNNNNDMGLYMSYDGTTFNGYVLSQETTLTEVSFMFDFYQVSQLTSFTWKNYIDMVFSQSGGSEVTWKLFVSNGTFTVPNSVTSIKATLIGGGGGGGISRNRTSSGVTRYMGGGGGSGYSIINSNISVTPGEELTILVGTGGLGGTSRYNSSTSGYDNTTATDGGNSIIRRGTTSLLTAQGGKHGTNATSASSGNNGSGEISGTGGGTVTVTYTYTPTSLNGKRNFPNYIHFYAAEGGAPGPSYYDADSHNWFSDGKNGSVGLVLLCWGNSTAYNFIDDIL